MLSGVPVLLLLVEPAAELPACSFDDVGLEMLDREWCRCIGEIAAIDGLPPLPPPLLLLLLPGTFILCSLNGVLWSLGEMVAAPSTAHTEAAAVGVVGGEPPPLPLLASPLPLPPPPSLLVPLWLSKDFIRLLTPGEDSTFLLLLCACNEK